MAKVIKAGKTIQGYTIINEINRGAFAYAYAAKTATGKKVLLKQYKSPSVHVVWQKEYVEYQKEIKRRVNSSALKGFCYEMIDSFEVEYGHLTTFFQVFEFVNGIDLAKYLKANKGSKWSQKVILAKLMMSSIGALHDQKIIHSDLKPENIILFEDKTIAAGYRLKLINLDFSILSDKQAPWDGQEGYVGTEGYFSPEHLLDVVPSSASDVFTCGLMLYELLGDGHPYLFDDSDDYKKAVLSFSATPPYLNGDIADGKLEQAVAIIHACLNPDPSARPSARDVAKALMGHSVSEAISIMPRPPIIETPVIPLTKPELSPKEPLKPLNSGNLVLTNGDVNLSFGIRSDIGKILVQNIGDDSKFWSDIQFTVDRQIDGWYVIPSINATNETLLNGRAITTPHHVSDGDIIAVGREDKGIIKTPLTISIT